MYFLIPLTAALIALVAFNLVLTVGLIRRMREFEAESGHAHGGGRPALPGPALNRGDAGPAALGLPARTPALVGVFSTRCKACPSHLPEFAALARERAAQGMATLAVLGGDRDRIAEFHALLGDAATVVEDLGDGPMGSGDATSGLAIRSWPSYVLFDASARVEAVGLSLADLPIRRPVPA